MTAEYHDKHGSQKMKKEKWEDRGSREIILMEDYTALR